MKRLIYLLLIGLYLQQVPFSAGDDKPDLDCKCMVNLTKANSTKYRIIDGEPGGS